MLQSAALLTPTTVSPDEEGNEDLDEDQFDPDSILKNLDFETKANLAMLVSQQSSREDFRCVLQRALDFLDHRVTTNRPRRGPSFNASAKALGRALLQDPSFGSTSTEGEYSQTCRDNQPNDPDFIPDTSRETTEPMSLAAMKTVLRLKEKLTHAALKKLYPRYRPGNIKWYEECVAAGGPIQAKIKRVNDGVLEKIKAERDADRFVDGRMIRRWGLEIADEVNLPRTYFKASHTWLYKLKKKGRIGSRRVTEYVTRSDANSQDVIDERIDGFLSAYERLSPRYPRRLIINTDQTGFNYEITHKRTLTYIGERDVRLRIDQKNKMTHSYTAQPTITREGRTFGKLFLVMQEAQRGTFGPIVERRVRQLEAEYGNIRVMASHSGKLTGDHFMAWIADVFHPAVNATLRTLDTDTDIESVLSGVETLSVDDDVFDSYEEPPRSPSAQNVRIETPPRPHSHTVCNPTERNNRTYWRCYKSPHTMLLADAWSGQTSRETLLDLHRRGVQYLEIPKKTTKFIQPLDVYFNLQYKKFVKFVFEAAMDPSSGVPISYLTSREGIINTHSLIWNQFASEAYTDMLRYAWHNTDPHWSFDEMVNHPKPRGVIEIQFENLNASKCQHHDHDEGPCQRPAYIRCAHCGKNLCIKHFLDRVCFHEIDDGERAGPSGVTRPPRPTYDSDSDDSK